MNSLKTIENKVLKLILFIENKYPELYTFLDETPVTIPSINNPDMNKKIMEDYFESLKQLIKHHIETHKEK